MGFAKRKEFLTDSEKGFAVPQLLLKVMVRHYLVTAKFVTVSNDSEDGLVVPQLQANVTMLHYLVIVICTIY